MTATEYGDSLSEDLRRAIFFSLVELQDSGASVKASRSGIALRFDVTPQQVMAIEREGLDHDWPPLSELSAPKG
jgi:hypothetical protein